MLFPLLMGRILFLSILSFQAASRPREPESAKASGGAIGTDGRPGPSVLSFGLCLAEALRLHPDYDIELISDETSA